MLFAEMEGRAPARLWSGVAGAPPSKPEAGCRRANWKIIRPVAMMASAAVIPMSFRPVRRLIDLLGSTSDSSLIPSGVISNAQEKTSASGNPSTTINDK